MFTRKISKIWPDAVSSNKKTKNSLVEVIHNEVGLNKREAKEFIEEFVGVKISLISNGPNREDLIHR